MRTRAGKGLNASVQRVADHARSLVQLEVELAKLEVAQKVKGVTLGAVLLATAALLGLLGVTMVFTAVAWAFALILPVWAAFAVSAGILFLLAGALAAAGAAIVKRKAPPVPEQAIEEARRTGEALRANGR